MKASEWASIKASLRSNFVLLTETLGGNETTTQKWSDAFISRYTEPQRHYHTIEHINAMLECFDRCRHLVKDEVAVKLAIFFHDWVYDPKGKDNEIESVQCFQTFAGEMGLSDSMTARVAGYIERTITHTLPIEDADSDCCLFLDFDLEVLSRCDTAYAHYDAQIQQEYGHMTVADYCAGRIKVLRSFLGRVRLYFSDVFYESHEKKARGNLELEISSLETRLARLSPNS